MGSVKIFSVMKFNARRVLTRKLRIQENFLREKARVWWAKDGDRNTGYYHSLLRIRKAKQPLAMLRNWGWRSYWYAGDQEAYVIQFYSNLFNKPETAAADLSIVDSAIENSVLCSENIDLTKLPSVEEIERVVFSIDASSTAPGPDGFSGSFYQHCWEIVKEDVILVMFQKTLILILLFLFLRKKQPILLMLFVLLCLVIFCSR